LLVKLSAKRLPEKAASFLNLFISEAYLILNRLSPLTNCLQLQLEGAFDNEGFSRKIKCIIPQSSAKAIWTEGGFFYILAQAAQL
jgi:hypothetical protein